MRRKTKKILASAMACVMLGTAVGGATLAYLTDNETATNTITVGKVDIELSEPNWPDQDPDSAADDVILKVPTEEVLKDPLVKNVGNNPAIIFMSVEVPKENVSTIGFDGNNFQSADEKKEVVYFKLADDDPKSLNNNFNTGTEISGTAPAVDGKWILLEKKEGENSNTYIFGYDTRVDSGKETEPLFEKIQLINAVNDESYNVNAKDIIINAYAIQQNNIGDGLADGELNETTLESIYDILINQIEATGGNTGDNSGSDIEEPKHEPEVNIPRTITYHANGGYFEDDLTDSENSMTYIWTKEVINNVGQVEKTAHTSNISSPYSEGYDGYETNLSYTEVINIPGAEELNVSITYQCDPVTEWVAIYDGSVQPTEENYNLSVSGKLQGDFNPFVPFTVPGDTVQIYFKSDDVQKTLFGYYAYVKGTTNEPQTIYNHSITDGIYLDPEHETLIFDGWSLEPNGPRYIFDESVVLENDLTLYAKWREPGAEFASGVYLNERMLSLADSDRSTWYNDSKIKAIKQADTMPDLTTMTSDNMVHSNQSDYPIYMWFDENDGSINWWSEDTTPTLNSDSRYTFYELAALTDIEGIKNWDASHAEYFDEMFYECESLKNIGPVSEWDVSSVSDMSDMFLRCYALESFEPLMDWETSSLTDLEGTFASCTSITSLDGLDNWTTGSVFNMNSTFYGMTSLTDITSLRDWNTTNVKDMTSIFDTCSALPNLNGLENWNTGKVADFTYAFSASGISNVDALLNWNVNAVESTYYMFYVCKNLQNVDGLINWKTNSVTNMSDMFCGCSKLANVNGLKNWNVSTATNIRGLFWGCNNLSDITGLKDWNVGSVTNMDETFKECYKIPSLDALINWNVSSVESMHSMFSYCTSIENANGLTNWNTISLKSTYGMFTVCSNLKDVEGLRNWKTSTLNDIGSMFSYCSNLTTLEPLNEWNISGITSTMYYFIEQCPATKPNWKGTWGSYGSYMPAEN